ncbi:MAG: alpha/beta hydrolase [Lachnospiraceae bacterium]|nr:alpha/beta hydrolase [Ruminococcus sp.]MCM1273814.1 alpha/beta hydrolase [Lachnospiraceae bacterium]
MAAGLDFTDRLKSAAAETLVVVGERDKPNAKAARELSALLGCRSEIVPCSGHEVNIDNPKALAELIAGFYEKLRFI